MQKPSSQFTEKLENDLRMAYRAQYQPTPVAHPIMRFLKIFVPAFSGAMVLILILWNLKGTMVPTNQQNNPNDNSNNPQNVENTDSNLEAFDVGTNEDQFVQDFDNDELNQIDNGVKLVAESNY